MATAVLAFSVPAAPAAASEDERLCGSAAADRTRGSVPPAFPLDACFDGNRLILHNSRNSSVFVNTDGRTHRLEGSGEVTTVSTAVERMFAEGILGGDHSGGMMLLVPSARGSVDVPKDRDVNITLAIGPAVVDTVMFLMNQIASYVGAGVIIAAYDIIAEFVRAVVDAKRSYDSCVVNANVLKKAGCTLGLTGSVIAAIAKAAAKAAVEKATTFGPSAKLAKSVVDLLLHANNEAIDATVFSRAPALRIVKYVPPTIHVVPLGPQPSIKAASGMPMMNQPAPRPTPAVRPATPTTHRQTPTTAGPAPTTAGTAGPTAAGQTPAPPQPTAPAGGGKITWTSTEDPFICNSVSRPFGVFHGFVPGEGITFISTTATQKLLPGTANNNGDIQTVWYCTPGDAGAADLTAQGSSSGRQGTAQFRQANPNGTSTPTGPPPMTGLPTATAQYNGNAFDTAKAGGGRYNGEIVSGATYRIDGACYTPSDISSNNGWWYHNADTGHWAAATVFTQKNNEFGAPRLSGGGSSGCS